MTSPEWEAANEDDSDRFPQTSHASAPTTESHEHGSRVVPDPERVARYAEALWHVAVAGLYEPGTPAEWDKEARAVMAVADEERAALVAEVERLRGEVKHWEHHAWEAGEGFKRAIEDGVRVGARRRAAEAKLAKVEALADEWFNDFHPAHVFGADLRAVLADAPAEQRAGA